MDKICRRCNNLLQTDDIVKAEIVTKFVALKSKLIYALQKPTACLWVEHKNCQSPQMNIDEQEEELPDYDILD